MLFIAQHFLKIEFDKKYKQFDKLKKNQQKYGKINIGVNESLKLNFFFQSEN